MNKLNIGLFGFGCVGQGLYQVLKQSQSIDASISKICIKNPYKDRIIEARFFTDNKWDILNDPTINVVVELIDNADEAFLIVSEALKRGKAVVTANKKMLAEHFSVLYKLQQDHKVPLLYEGSVCGAIPILRALETYYTNDIIESVEGIFNGTTNYILTKTATENLSYADALKGAQLLGFAETNPKLDVEAYDPKYKLTILLAHAFGLVVPPDKVLNYGIQYLSRQDTTYALENDYTIKLLARAYKTNNGIAAFVLPRLVKQDNPFTTVSNEFNAVQVNAAYSDLQLLKGKGAGSLPTAAAVLSDITALASYYQYGYGKLKNTNIKLDTEELLTIYLRYKDNAIFELLRFHTVEQQYISKDFNYIIGSVSIDDLLNANLNDQSDLFVAEVELQSNVSANQIKTNDRFVSIH